MSEPSSKAFDITMGALAVQYPPLAILLKTGLKDQQRLMQNLVVWASMYPLSDTLAKSYVLYMVYTSTVTPTDLLKEFHELRDKLSPETQQSINTGLNWVINRFRDIHRRV